jgi:hypothetical protein
VRLVAASVPEAWQSYRRFGSLDLEPGNVPAGLLPSVARLKADLDRLPSADGLVSADTMAAFAKTITRLQRSEDLSIVTAPLIFQAPGFVGRRQSLADWATALRREFDRGDAGGRAPLGMVLDEIAATPVGKRLAADVVAGLGPGSGEFLGRLETPFPSVAAAVVIAWIGADPGVDPKP